MASMSSAKPDVGLDEAVGHGDAALVVDLRFVDGIAGIGVEHLVAGVHDRGQELADDRFAAGLNRDLFGAVRDLTLAAHVVGQHGTQFGNAGAGAVAGVAVGDGLVRGFDDVGRRRQVDVAQVKGIDLVALGRPRRGRGRDRKRSLSAQFVQLICEFHRIPILHRSMMTLIVLQLST